MAYKAKIVDKRLKVGKLVLAIEYKKGKNAFTEEVTLTSDPGPDYLANLAAQRIKELEALETLAASITTDTDITPIEKTPETIPASETKRQNYLKKLDKLTQGKKLVELGVLTDQEADIETLKEEVKTAHADL